MTISQSAASNPTTVVSTPFGDVRGLDRNATHVFKGIRFATAQRFEAPVLITDWRTELDATMYGAQCHQTPGMLERTFGSGSLPMTEDCLFLNVFMPSAHADVLRPVLVWIHGGAFVNGSGATPWYDGSELASRADVVVVTVNYRLGAFGYLGDLNLGTRDQIAALQWVHDAIASFGGDPGNVTIFGESAGGSAVVALLATPPATGLFHRAFAMSPSITQLRNAHRASEAESQFLAAARVSDREQALSLTPDQMLDAQQLLLRDVGAGFSGFSPTSGTSLIPMPIRRAAAANPVPLVLGTTRDEMQMFTAFSPSLAQIDDATLEAMARARFGDELVATALEAYRSARPTANNSQLAAAIQTDETFRVPARLLAEDRAAAGMPTWMYWFTWASTAFGGVLGSCHAIDVPFAFHNLNKKGVAAFTGESPERTQVADAYSEAIVGLATTGRAGWSQFDSTRRSTLQVDVVTAVIDDPEPEIRLLWE